MQDPSVRIGNNGSQMYKCVPDDRIPLSKSQIRQILERGYTYAFTCHGIQTITKEDLMIDDETVEMLKRDFGIYPDKKIGEK